jgi:chromosome segregation ATPase
VRGELARSKADYEALIHSLHMENDTLKDDIHVLETKLGAYERETHELEEELAAAERDTAAIRQQLNQAQTQLSAFRSGGRVQELEEKLASCTQLLQEKEVQNETLLREMQELTRENDELRTIQHEHVSEVQVRHTTEQKRAILALEEKQREIQILREEIETHKQRNSQLEGFKFEHDAMVLELRNKMAEYERGYNLTDAVAEIRTLKTQIKKQQLERTEERDLINKREKELQRWVAENKQLRAMAGVGGDWGLNEDDLQLQLHIEHQKLAALHRQDTKIIQKLEADRLELLDELRKGATDRTRDGLVFFGLDANKTKLLEEYAERLRNDDPSLPQNDMSAALQSRVTQLASEVDTWKDRYARIQVEKEEMNSKMMTLMERDKSLAYEQILKQLTDLKVQYNMAQLSQSTPFPQGGFAAPAPGMPAIPETPGSRGGGLRSPMAQRRPSTPAPLPPGSSTELRQTAEKASSLSMQERHALFTRLYSEFAPAAAPLPAQQATMQQVMPGSRLLSPRSSVAAKSAEGPQQFVFPPVSAAGAAPQPAVFQPLDPLAVAGGPVDSVAAAGINYVPSLSLDSNELAGLDAGAKGRFAGCLQELLGKERENNELLDSLELYQIRFEKLSARQQMLYIEYNNARRLWAEEKATLKVNVEKVIEEKESMELQLAKVQASAPSSDGSRPDPNSAEYRDELEVYRRRNLVLSTNEKVLSRRFNSLAEEHQYQAKKLESLRKEFSDMERTLRLRVLELSKRKKILESRNASIQALVSNWVPKEELFKLARKYNWVSAAYAGMLAKADLAIVDARKVETLSRENDNLRYKQKEYEEELRLQVEKNEQLQQALDAVETTMIPNPDLGSSRGKGSLAARFAAATSGKSSGSATPALSTGQSMPALLAELADLRAREGSAAKRCARLDENLASVNSHSLELEEELLQLRRKHHELSLSFDAEQQVVLELKNKLEGSVPYHKANSLQQQLLEAGEKLSEALAQAEHYKATAELASNQALELLNLRPEDSRAEGHDDLVKELRSTIEDLESRSDDNRRVGSLHREVMNLKLELRESTKKREDSEKELTKTQARILMLEKELDVKNTDLYRLHTHARAAIANKESEILQLTASASTTAPVNPNQLNHPMTLQQAETIHAATMKMQQQLNDAEDKLKEVTDENQKLALEAKELRVKLQAAQELARLLPLPAGKAAAAANRLKMSSGRRGAGAPESSNPFDVSDEAEADSADRPLPPSLSLQTATSALDSDEYSLRLRQALAKYSQDLSRHKLNEVRLEHQVTALESKLSFVTNEVKSYESQLGKLQQQLVEKDLYIQNKENAIKEERLALAEQQTKLKMNESLARMERAQQNKKAQRNAVKAIRRITGREDEGQGAGAGDEEDDDPFNPKSAAIPEETDVFTLHNEDGTAVDVDDLDIGEELRQSLNASAIGAAGGANPRQLEGLLTQLQDKMRLAKQVMTDQKERIAELESELQRWEKLKAADATALATATEVANTERARLLSTAQATILNLNEQLASKNARLDKYQEMLDSAQAKFQSRRVQYEAEIERLNSLLLDKNSSNLTQLKGAMNFLDELPRLPKDVVSRVEMEDILKEKEGIMNQLNKEIEFLNVRIKDEVEARAAIDNELKKLYKESSEEIKSQRAQVAELESLRTEDAKLVKLVAKLQAENKAKENELGSIQEAMATLKNEMVANKALLPSGAAGGEAKEDASGSSDPAELKKQISALERKVKAVTAALTKERLENQKAKDNSNDASAAVAAKDEALSAAQAATAKTQADLDAARLKIVQLQGEITRIKEVHAKHKTKSAKELEEARIAAEKARDIAERKAKLEAKMSGTGGAAALSSSLGGASAAPEKQKPSPAPATGEEKSEGVASAQSAALAGKAFDAWEAEKKSSKKAALLEKRLTKSSADLRQAQENIASLTAKVAKEQKEKIDLISRLTSLQGELAKAKGLSASSLANLSPLAGAEEGGAAERVSEAEIEKAMSVNQLKQRIFELESERDALQKKIQVDLHNSLLKAREEAKEATKKTEQLMREKRELERALKASESHRPASAVRKPSSLGGSDASALESHISSLESSLSASEQKVLDLTMSNLDLKYQVEHSNILVGRLRARVAEQAALVKLVDGAYLSKEWKDALPAEVKEYIDSVSAGSEGGAGVKQARSLTLILGTFKKIFEKLKTENENLKKNSQSNVDYMSMIRENKNLKKKLETALANAAAAATAAPQPHPATEPTKKEKHTDEAKEHAESSSLEPVTVGATTPSTGNLVDKSELDRAYSLHTLTRKELKKEQELVLRLKKKVADLTKSLEDKEALFIEMQKRSDAAIAAERTEWFRKEKNFTTTIHDLTRAKTDAEEEVKKLKALVNTMRKQMQEMNQLIQTVREKQQWTQGQPEKSRTKQNRTQERLSAVILRFYFFLQSKFFRRLKFKLRFSPRPRPRLLVNKSMLLSLRPCNLNATVSLRRMQRIRKSSRHSMCSSSRNWRNSSISTHSQSNRSRQ